MFWLQMCSSLQPKIVKTSYIAGPIVSSSSSGECQLREWLVPLGRLELGRRRIKSQPCVLGGLDFK